jgi:molybdate transport system substrate-binding protein
VDSRFVSAVRQTKIGPFGRILVLCAIASAFSAASAPGVVAQAAAWDCPAPVETATSPATPATGPSAAAAPSAFPAEGGDLTVFAAASLTDAFEAMQADLAAANPNLAITYNFGGSQALVTQLSEGAAADVFASANTAQMDAAVAAGVIAGESVSFVHNRLAVVTPADNPAGITALADLGREGLRIILAQPEVPAGRYAREAVCLMGHDPEAYGTDFVNRVAANVVSEEEDVRDVLAKVQLGEADAGIVYVSDAAFAGDEVLVIDIPDEVNVIATYPVAVVTGGDEPLATAFIAYLLGSEGQATLAEFGFEPVNMSDAG